MSADNPTQKVRPPDAGAVGLRDLPKLVAIRRDSERRAALFTQPDLTYLFWESTLKCNLKCTHCGSDCGPVSPVKELSTEQVLGILDTIGEDFDCSRIFVSITGGEPLIRADLYQVVEHMTRLGMGSCIVTNGTLLTVERGKRLHDAGMRTVSISVDGLEVEHNAMRGKDTFRKTLAGITAAREAGMDVIEAITCVRPANLSQLHEIERTVRAAGANLHRLITIDKMGRGKADDELWLKGAEVRQLFDFVEERRSRCTWERDHFDVRFSCGGFLGVGRELSVRPGDGQCFAGLSVASILADGQVSACPSLPRNWAQGSALEERFSTIWFRRFNAYRDVSWRKTGACEGCSYFSLCLGGGLHERLHQPECFCWIDRQMEDLQT